MQWPQPRRASRRQQCDYLVNDWCGFTHALYSMRASPTHNCQYSRLPSMRVTNRLQAKWDTEVYGIRVRRSAEMWRPTVACRLSVNCEATLRIDLRMLVVIAWLIPNSTYFDLLWVWICRGHTERYTTTCTINRQHIGMTRCCATSPQQTEVVAFRLEI